MKHAWFLFILLSLPQQLSAAIFDGAGQAVVIDGDVGAAETLASNAARSQAIEAAMRAYAERGGIDRHDFNLKKSALLAGDRAFILRERIANREYTAPLLRLELQIEVDMQLLARAMGREGLATRAQREAKARSRPMAVVVVAEEINGAMNSFPYSAREIEEALLVAEYPLVDQTAVARATKHDQAVQAVFANDTASARALALQFDAGLMITGRAVAQKSGIAGGGMQAYGANVALTAVRTDTGRVVASSSADGSYPHINAITGSRLALEEAANEAAEDLLAKLAEHDSLPSSQLRLTVNGVNYEQLAILRKILLRDFSSVISVDTRGFGGDIARLDLDLDDTVVAFAEALAARDFGSFRLRVLSQSAGKIDTSVQLN